jgi:hypothetical protein
MSQVLDETFSRLLQSLQPYPRMQFLLFAGEWGEREKRLLEFCEREDHTLLLYRLPGFEADEAPPSPRIRQRPWKASQERYNLQGKLYNHAFVMSKPPEAPEEFLRKVYTGIANAGGIYLFLPREEAGTWETALQNDNYVAIAPIDRTEDTLLLGARKMHGWGG